MKKDADAKELASILEALSGELDEEQWETLEYRLEQLGTTEASTSWMAYCMAVYCAEIIRRAVNMPRGTTFGLDYGELEFPEREYAQAVSCLCNGDKETARDILIAAFAAGGRKAAGRVIGFAMQYIYMASKGINVKDGQE